MVGQAVEASTPFGQQSVTASVAAMRQRSMHSPQASRAQNTHVWHVQLATVCACACAWACPATQCLATARGSQHAGAERAPGLCRQGEHVDLAKPRRPAGQRRLGELPRKHALLLESCYTPRAPAAAGLIAWSMCVHTGSLHPAQLLRQTLNPHLRRLWPAALKQPWSQPAGQRRLD